MYAVLVDAMTRKLMVGTPHDIPLEEILIYIENIPIYMNDDALMKLTTITAINRNTRILQEAKINMSVLQIMEKPQELMIKVIDHLIQRFGIYS